jgi:spore germination cell wall hydrolase CwlJ-like protein
MAVLFIAPALPAWTSNPRALFARSSSGRGESYTGMVAVGAVVVNRVNSGSFPNSISGVIYQSGQFTPVATGTFQSVLSRGARSDCYAAAQAALSGESPVGGCLYFNSGYGSGIQIGYQHFY